MNAPPDFASHAFRYAMRGWHIFRLSPGSRIPTKGSHGHLDASRELDVIRVWWRDMPTANIGCAMGAATGAWILDVDRQHGGPLALAELTGRHGALPETLFSRTPSGGFHHYFAWDDGIPEIRCSVSRVGPGLDVIGAGGAVPLPPSIRTFRGAYSWIDAGAEIVPAPDWLVALTRPPVTPRRDRENLRVDRIQGDTTRYVSTAIEGELRCLAGAAQGQRNYQLNKSAYSLATFVGAGAVPETWARSKLEDTAIGIGLSVIEARRTIASAFAAGLQNPRELPS